VYKDRGKPYLPHEKLLNILILFVARVSSLQNIRGFHEMV
jgi:hypothetical protein